MQLSELQIKNATREALRKKRTCLSRSTNTIANSKRERKAKRFCSFLFLVSSNLKEGEGKKKTMTKSEKKNTYSINNVCTAKARARGAKRKKKQCPLFDR